MENYATSPKMIGGTVYCNEKASAEQLREMDINRRWNEDNRLLTWTFGLVNAGYDQRFIQNGGIINDTDDRVQKIVDKNEEEHDELKGYRNIKNNGNWNRIEHILKEN